MKVGAYVRTDNPSSEVWDILDIPDDEKGGVSEREKEDFIDERLLDWVDQNVQWGWERVDEEE